MSEKERQHQLESTYRDIATIISEKCINPETKKPYPVSIIEKCMKQVHFSVKPNRNSKQQAIELIPQLKSVIPIERARMKLKILTHKKNKDKFKEFVKVSEVETVHDDGQLEMVMKLIVSIELTNKNAIFSRSS